MSTAISPIATVSSHASIAAPPAGHELDPLQQPRASFTHWGNGRNEHRHRWPHVDFLFRDDDLRVNVSTHEGAVTGKSRGLRKRRRPFARPACPARSARQRVGPRAGCECYGRIYDRWARGCSTPGAVSGGRYVDVAEGASRMALRRRFPPPDDVDGPGGYRYNYRFNSPSDLQSGT